MTEQIDIPDVMLEDPLACADFFNNWSANLPGGFRRRDYAEEIANEPNSNPTHRMGKTERQFWDDIDNSYLGVELIDRG